MRRKQKKGLTLIFEQVMLFAISVTIFLISLAVFDIYQNFYLSVGSDNQLDEAKEWVSTNILKVAEKEGSTSFHVIPVPRYVGGAVYEIKLEQNGLTITNLITSATKFSSLYTLNESYSLSGTVASIKGKITIKKEDNTIIIV